jgi:SAM-dependent methyltransferases related to tRNA (uracil-5-)-methyltransferase
LSAGAAETPAPFVADITDLDHDGRGIAHVDGKTVFVDGALPGERVEWRRFKKKRTFDEGRLVRVLEPSPDRVEPKCPHFGMCGGCVLQHLAPERQIELKQRQLLDALSRIGNVAPASVLPPLLGPTWNYRRRARLGARWVPNKGKTVIGFRERASSFVADLSSCVILAKPVDELIEPLSELVSRLSIRARVPQIEVAVAERATALVMRVLDEPTAEDRALLEAFERSFNVEIYLQPGNYDTVAPLKPPASVLEYRLPAFDVAVRFAPTDFIQVNGELNAAMVERAIAHLSPRTDERVLDLFCGLGNFSLPLARSGAAVTAVEGEAGLIERARENAARQGFANVEFHVADLSEPDFMRSPWAQRDYDKVLLDPPRAGARAALPLLARASVQRVVYVSCHPGTLARDAGILVNEYGFKLEAAGVMDMFPHTAHVESIAVFTR